MLSSQEKISQSVFYPIEDSNDGTPSGKDNDDIKSIPKLFQIPITVT